MKTFALLFGSLVLAALPSVALCDPVITGGVGLGFATASTLGVSANDYTIDARGLVTLDDPGFNVQLEGGDHHLEASGGSADLWSASLDAFWRDSKGSIGLSYAHGSLSSTFGGDLNSYGAFGEWFADDDLTLRWKAGHFDATGNSGSYVGVGGGYYPLPDLSLSASYTYTDVSAGGLHNVAVNVDYLISREWPVTVGVGYGYANVGNTNANAFMVRLAYRFGLGGSLVNDDRHGPIGWTGNTSFL